MSRTTAHLPAGVGLTHLRVYETVAPDGLQGGSPHLHFICTECYYVQSGRGRAQTLAANGFHEFALEPGRVVWFSPGVIHRLVNDGELEIFVVMQNGGLPEAGDFVLTMPESILSDSRKYLQAASLSPHGEVFASSEAAAYRRRDLAVEGFRELREKFEREGESALREFYALAAPLVKAKAAAWRELWSGGALAAAHATGEHLAALERGEIAHLMSGTAHAMAAPGAERKLGMCGTLGTYLPEGVTVAAQINRQDVE